MPSLTSQDSKANTVSSEIEPGRKCISARSLEIAVVALSTPSAGMYRDVVEDMNKTTMYFDCDNLDCVKKVRCDSVALPLINIMIAESEQQC